MPELILLCAAAATDHAPAEHAPATAPADALALRRVLEGGAFARAFAHAATAGDRSDDSLLPRELPEDAWWRERLGVPESDAIQAYAAIAHGLPLPCWRVTPTHVQIGLDQARLADPTELALSAEESASLAGEAAPVFADYGLSLHAPSPRAWFLMGELEADLQTRSWSMAVGRNVDAYLPRGEPSRRWRKLLNEVQMTWFAAATNQARETRGAPPINMLWLDGRASAALAARPGTVVTRDDAARGLAIAGGARPHDPGDGLPDPGALRAMSEAGGDVIVDAFDWARARRLGDGPAWIDAWREFDDWIARIGLDRGIPGGFSGVCAIFTGERRRLELRAHATPRWRRWRAVDPIGLVT